jgi:hypothetical protein
VRVQMMAVGVKTGGAVPEVGATVPRFTARMLPSNVFTDHDVTRDGQRFLVGAILDGSNVTRPSSIVVRDWMAELKK